MAGKISRDSQNSVQPWLHLLLCARFYQSRCRTLSSACRAVSNRFFFLQFALDIQSEENIRGCEILRRKWRKQRGREKLSRIAGRRLWSKEINIFRRTR